MSNNENLPTLADIARQTYWEPGIELDDHTIEKALHEVGLNANDQKEKLRFMNLVKEAYHYRMQNEIAQLGKYADKARSILSENSSYNDVIELASKFQNEEEREEEDQE